MDISRSWRKRDIVSMDRKHTLSCSGLSPCQLPQKLRPGLCFMAAALKDAKLFGAGQDALRMHPNINLGLQSWAAIIGIACQSVQDSSHRNAFNAHKAIISTRPASHYMGVFQNPLFSYNLLPSVLLHYNAKFRNFTLD